MIFDLNAADTKPLLDNLEKARSDVGKHLPDVVEKAKTISGYIEPHEFSGEPFINGKVPANRVFCWKIRHYGGRQLSRAIPPFCT